MRRVNSAPSLCGGLPPIPHSTSGEKLDKANPRKRTKVQSISDLANLSAIPLIENQLVQYSQLVSTSKGVASIVCFEAESKDAPAIREEREDLASCLSSPLMEEGDPTLELDIVDLDRNIIVPLKRPKRRVLTRWDVPSRIGEASLGSRRIECYCHDIVCIVGYLDLADFPAQS